MDAGHTACDRYVCSVTLFPGKAGQEEYMASPGAVCAETRGGQHSPVAQLQPITRSRLVQAGQQQPKIPVMQPASQTCREVEDSRLVAWVHRTLRRKQNKLARENSYEERPSVTIKVCRCGSFPSYQIPTRRAVALRGSPGVTMLHHYRRIISQLITSTAAVPAYAGASGALCGTMPVTVLRA